jgi:iron complex outermembrane recepter protein
MMVKFPGARPLVISLLLSVSCWPVVSQAQTADKEQGLDEIVVTAQKRAENAQDVPISVSAISGDDLEKAGISNLEDAAFRVPNLVFPKYTDQKLASVTLRGISDPGGSAGQDPGVAIYMD